MIPGHGSRDAQFSNLVSDGSPGCKLSTALELEKCASRGILVKGLFFPSGPFSLVDVRSFLLLA